MTIAPLTGGHIALLGDSVFDNRRYAQPALDVVSHLRALLPEGWAATLLARDGSPAYQVAGQLAGLPADATHLVVSAGGNDLLMMARFLPAKATTTVDAVRMLGEKAAGFEREYRDALAPVLALGRDVTLCTVYNANFPEPQASFTRVAVSLFDDVILRFAFKHGLRVIDLRAVCTGPADFANALEPSGEGGLKIARMVAEATGALPSGRAAQVFVPRSGA
jgi:hypothetical protein